MPVAADDKKNKWAPLDPKRVIDCVAGMTRTTKGYGFSQQKSSTGRLPTPVMSPITRVSSGSSVVSLPSQPPRAVELYGKTVPIPRSKPLDLEWDASMGSSSMPRPFTRSEIERRRIKVHPRPRPPPHLFSRLRPRLRTQSSSAHYPKGPMVVFDDDAAAAYSSLALSRPSTSSFSKMER